MLPITGPFTKVTTEIDSITTRVGYKQKPPFDRPLAFQLSRYQGWETVVYESGSPTLERRFTGYGVDSHGDSRSIEACYNTAYDNFKNKVSDSAGWAENLAQITKTRKTVVERSVQLANFVSALRRGNIKRAAKVLRTPVPSGVSNRKAVSQNFLEWEYGVKPVISDLQSSMRILLSDPGIRRIKAGAQSPLKPIRVQTKETQSNAFSTWRESADAEVSWILRADVRVSNPNLFLANQLGIIDVALPWKLIPFSFVVDWFVNVEQVLSSVTDFYGLDLINPQRSRLMKGRYDLMVQRYFLNPPAYGYTRRQATNVEMIRLLGFSRPTLVVRPFKGFSVQRGAQAIALVIATLGK